MKFIDNLLFIKYFFFFNYNNTFFFKYIFYILSKNFNEKRNDEYKKHFKEK